MNNEIFEKIKKEDSLQDDTENFKKIESLQKRSNLLEDNLILAEDSFQEKQRAIESLNKELNKAHTTLSQIEEIMDKLKINSAKVYELSVSELKYIQNLLYEIKN